MDDIDPLFHSIDKLIRLSRLKEIEFIMSSDQADRVHEIRAALRRLPAGQYLLGTGPSTVGIIYLDQQEVVLGRPATVLEHPKDAPADYWATDTLFFVPREVSRTHAKLIRQFTDAGVRHLLIDLDSTCGTFVNKTQISPAGNGVILEHGDIVSLGPSRTSTYVYYCVTSSPTEDMRASFHAP